MSEIKTATIGKDFSLPELMKFVAPPIVTRLFVSFLSTLDDSLFVSRFCGQNALAAFSVAMPWFMLVDAIGMLMMGVSTVCSIKMGMKKEEQAKSDFTTMVVISYIVGFIMTIILVFFLDNILFMLGETEILLPYAREYMAVSKFYIPLILSSYIYSSFYVIAGKPKWSMYSQGINTFCQFFFDWFFIVKLKTGIVGAAYANLIGNICVNLLAIIFYQNRNNEIHFTYVHHDYVFLFKEVFKYGKMQLITSLAISLSSYINNSVHLSIGGESVVAAYTIVSNITFMFMNSFFGLVGSLSPLVGYAYGEKNTKKLAKVCYQSITLVSILMLIIVLIIFLGRKFFLFLYLAENSALNVREMAQYGIKIYPFALIFFGYNILVQEFVNVVGKTKTSIFLSIMENIFFQNSMTVLMPIVFGHNGVWFSFLATEILTFFLTCYVVYMNRYVYGYGKGSIITFADK